MKTFYCSEYPDDSSAINEAIAYAAEHDEHATVVGRDQVFYAGLEIEAGQPTVGGLTGTQLSLLREIEEENRCKKTDLLSWMCAHCLGHGDIDYEGLGDE